MDNVMKVLQDSAEEETLVNMLDIVAAGGSFAATPECETYRTLACKLLGALQADGVDTDKYPVEDEEEMD